MRIHHLEMMGFAAFREKQSIDFTQANEGGLFLITGATGTGKSTILDAICYALFAKIPRYTGYYHRVRSQYCLTDEETRVTLIFSISGEKYRIARWLKKKRNSPHTEAAASLEIYRDSWEVLAAKPKEVGIRIEEILQLNANQFQQVILLAQGEFAEFLKAKTEDRREILSKIFNTAKYARLTEYLFRKYQKYSAEITAKHDEILRNAQELTAEVYKFCRVELAVELQEINQGWANEIEKLLQNETAKRKEIAEVAAKNRKALAAEYLQQAELSEFQQRYFQALARQEEIIENQVVNQELQEKYQKACKFKEISMILEELERQSAKAENQAVEIAQLQEKLSRYSASFTTDFSETDLRLELNELEKLQAEVLSNKLQMDKLHQGQNRLEIIGKEIAENEDIILKIPQELREIEKTKTEKLAQLAELQTLTKTEAELTERIILAEELAKLLVEIDLVKAELNQQELKIKELDLDYQQSLIKYHQGLAAELAQELEIAQPCPVCGSIEHPQLAQPNNNHISKDQIEQLLQKLNQNRENLVQLNDNLQMLNEKNRELSVQLGGKTREVLLVEQETCQQAISQMKVQESDIVELEAKLAELDVQRTACQERNASLALEKEYLIKEVALLAGKVTETQEKLLELFPNSDGDPNILLAEKISELNLILQDFMNWQQNIATLETISAVVKQQREVWEKAYREAGFTDSEAAKNSELGEHEITEIQLRLKQIETDKAEIAKIISDPKVALLTEKEINLEVAQADLETAEAAAENLANEAYLAQNELQKTQVKVEKLFRDWDSQEAKLIEITPLGELARAFSGNNNSAMNLESFILISYLKEVVRAANQRLKVMTSNRFQLQHTVEKASGKERKAGLGLEILDNYTGQTRSPESLSGGQTFLAALALALGLSDVVSARSGGIKLDTLFIDEGFGSLDDQTLDLTLSTLSDLRASGRTIGLISHVQKMKEQLPVAIEVLGSASGESKIRLFQH